MTLFETIFLYLMAAGYVGAGINHFVNPRFYLPMFPSYIPNPKLLNYVAGAAEIILGIGLMFDPTRSWSAMLIVIMLIAFLPVHIYMVQEGGKFPGGPKLPLWAAWLRLVPGQPLLIFCAWWFI